MKLHELFEKDIRLTRGATSAQFTKTKQASRGLKHLGGGVQGEAYELPSIPGTVIKTAKVRNPDKDGYVTFVKLALEHQDNPFFPKIYNAILRELTVSESGYPFELIVQMEKLHRMQTQELVDVVPHLFKRLGIELPSDDTFYLRQLFDDSNTRREYAEKTQNPKFKEALELLEPLFKKFRFQDLHSGNWMIRLTSVGPQLVIIDPFYELGSMVK